MRRLNVIVPLEVFDATQMTGVPSAATLMFSYTSGRLFSTNVMSQPPANPQMVAVPTATESCDEFTPTCFVTHCHRLDPFNNLAALRSKKC